MDLAGRIRMELADGKSPDQIIAELAAAGMSEPTARKHVHRAMGVPDPITAPPESSKDPSGKWALIQGAVMTSTIVCMMGWVAVTGLRTDAISGRRYAFGVLGLVFFARGLYKWSKSGTEFPTVGVVIGAMIPPILLGASVGWQRLESRTARAEVAAAAPAPERRSGPPTYTELIDGRSVRDAMVALQSPDPAVKCQGLRDIGTREMIERGETLAIYSRDEDTRVRACALDAFDTMLRSEVEDRRLSAVRSMFTATRDADTLLERVSRNDSSAAVRSAAAQSLESRKGSRTPELGAPPDLTFPDDFESGTADHRCQTAATIAQRELVKWNFRLNIMTFSDRDPRVRQCALDAFAAMLKSDSVETRRAAVGALDNPSREVKELLRQARKTEPEERIRRAIDDKLMRWAEPVRPR
jgi:hypothetical protein